MSSGKPVSSEELCRILKTGKPNNTIFSLPDELKKLSEAELLEFLNENEKEIIDGVIDTFSKCGIKITANDNKVIFESPGYYTTTFNVETGEQTKADAEAEAIPKAKAKIQTIPKPGFGSSSKRFPTNKLRVAGGTKFTGRNITKKNRANITHLKKKIRGMVMNGGSGIVIECFYYLCVSICLVVYSPFYIIGWTYKAIYKHFNNYAVTPIYTAVKMGNLTELNAILANLTDENKEILNQVIIDEDSGFIDSDNWKLLFVAVRKRNIEIVKALIEAGADVNTISYSGRTPLFDAVRYHNIEMVKALIEAGADVNKADNDRRTPLFNAVDNGYIEIVKALLVYGADVYARPINDRYSPIFKAKDNAIRAAQRNNQLWQENSTKILKLLETYGQRNTTLLLTEGVLKDLEVAHVLDASTEEDFYDYLGPDPMNKTSPFDAFNNGTPGGKKSRSKTRKQKRRKTKK
jgi:hypothetical protein